MVKLVHKLFFLKQHSDLQIFLFLLQSSHIYHDYHQFLSENSSDKAFQFQEKM